MKTPGLPEALDSNLIIKACSTEHDIERVAALNAEIHGVAEGAAVRRWLLEGHPQIAPAGWLFVEDTSSAEAIATLGLIPLSWRYASVSLPVAEMGFVGTRPAYRNRGLQRALSSTFERIALANGYSLAAIEGIPFFYRQFGYEYALPLFDSRFNLTLDQVPTGSAIGFNMRPATPVDIPVLTQLYGRQNASLTISTERSEAMWRTYLEPAAGRTPAGSGELAGLQVFLILQEDRLVGYLALTPSGWANRLNVTELAADADGATLAALHFARVQAMEGGYESIGLQLPARHPASHLARDLGIKEERTYGWQVKVLDPIVFLNTLAPALEGRLSESALCGHNGIIRFNLYRQQVGLKIQSGQIAAVALEAGAETDVNLPPQVAAQLWLGWKPFAALDAWHPDVRIREEKRSLLDTLFPPAEVHIYLGY